MQKFFINKKSAILFFVLVLGSAGFLFWAIAQNNTSSDFPPAANYAPNFWFDSEEKYFPCNPLDFYYENGKEISGEEALKKYNDLSKEEKIKNFTLFYYVKELEREWVYEYWVFYVFNDFKNEHYGDWESVFIFVNKDMGKITKVVGSAHQGGILNNEFSNPKLDGNKHIWVYVEGGSQATVTQKHKDLA